MSAFLEKSAQRPPSTPENVSGDGNAVGSLGADIRALRKNRSMTLTDLASALDRSVGFISQIERGLSKPSIDDLRLIAGVFDVPLGLFFGRPDSNKDEAGHVVRAQDRRVLGNKEAGLTEELLSPDLGGSFETIRSVFAPGASMDQPQQRETEEAGYVVSGELDLEINGRWFHLKTGDSFRFAGEAYRWKNPSGRPAVVIWVVSPPTY